MGIVDLDCIASNPSSTILYAIGNAENTSGNIVTAFFRSNSNPANATNITWERLHLSYNRYEDPTEIQPHYKYSRFGDVDCAVSSSGEFTAFFYNPQFSVTRSARMVPMGIRFNSDRTSTELEIYGSMMYGWTSQNLVHQSFYIEKDSVETVVHAVMDETASVIRFGLVNRDTGHLQLAAIWKLDEGRFMVGELTDKFPKLPNPKATTFSHNYYPAPNANADQRHMVYMNGRLYLYSDTTGLISSFPFSSPHTAPTQEVVYPASPVVAGRRNMVFQGARQNSSYLGYLARIDDFNDEELNSYIDVTLQLSILDFDNPSNATASTTVTNTTTQTFKLGNTLDVYKETRYLQAIGGHLPGQVPFAVSLTNEGYYGIILEGQSREPLILSNRGSTTEGAEDSGLRSRYRNHENQVILGYRPPIELSTLEEFGAAIGGIIGIMVLVVYLAKFDHWLKKIRLDNEKRAADMNSFELTSRLQYVNRHSSSNPSPNPPPPGGGAGASLFDSSSADTTSHTLLDGLGLTRHPQPNTVITIGDNDDEPLRTRVDRNTQQ